MPINAIAKLRKRALKVAAIEAFKVEVWLYVEKEWGDLHDELVKELNIRGGNLDDASEKTHYGVAMAGNTPDTQAIPMILTKKHYSVMLVAHESYHAVEFINRGLDNSLGEEACAELLEWLIGKFYKQTWGQDDD